MALQFLSQKSLCRGAAGRGRRRVTCLSSGSPGMSTDVETRVLVINTGGTIGMVLHDGVLSPEPNALVKTLRKLPILHDEQYAEQTKLYEHFKPEDKTLVLPKSKLGKRVVYTFLEYSPLLDSSNMTPNDWSTIGKDIEKYYEEYDGFVILHGTDTMAYTTSALSFMCENLGKPVILTGSQVPIFEMRSDGRDNLLGALLIAGQFVIPEVCLYFHHKLYRGNRVTKVDSGSFQAFTSPNLPPLANAEIDINSNSSSSWAVVRNLSIKGTICKVSFKESVFSFIISCSRTTYGVGHPCLTSAEASNCTKSGLLTPLLWDAIPIMQAGPIDPVVSHRCSRVSPHMLNPGGKCPSRSRGQKIPKPHSKRRWLA